ncbi:MAG: dTMP kinase [Candidatus Pacebacteria bacterium]|nr:dTMP kinase [Candidatus Paceibacterota bacterium]MDD4073990.1 dTMP kinase [Candidatus Paceibacterota bacterium]
MKNNIGKFIVLEGIDGCGKGTQTKILSEFLSNKGYDVVCKKYPEYGKPIGDLISKWLYSKEYDFSPSVQTLLYFADFVKDIEELENHIKNGRIVISDRYFTGTIVYQKLKGVPLEKILKLEELFKIKKPDVSIYIRIRPEKSFERKNKQKELDRHEKDKIFLKGVFENYEERVKDNTFCKWEVVDGEKSIEEVANNILKIIDKTI